MTSEIGIPFDSVDAEETTRPHISDMAAILRFTIVMGVVSSLFDAATFLILWKALAPVRRNSRPAGSSNRSRRKSW